MRNCTIAIATTRAESLCDYVFASTGPSGHMPDNEVVEELQAQHGARVADQCPEYRTRRHVPDFDRVIFRARHKHALRGGVDST
jgi:hypothetical protein